MRRKNKASKEKKPIVKWRGLLLDFDGRMRAMVFFVLLAASITLSFTQLGFASLPLGEGDKAYIVVLLIPIALSALLLGTGLGTLFGLLSGVVLFAHAMLLPLDYYELVFVTPLSSVVLMTSSGFLYGVLFAFALRNNPTGVKRFFCIVIPCFIVGWLYSIGFVFTIIVSLIEEMVQYLGIHGEDASMDVLQKNAAVTASSLGSVEIQGFVDVLLTSAACLLGSYASHKARELRQHMSTPTLFGAWLLTVVSLAFMGMAAVGFCFVTGDNLKDAEGDLRDEVGYLTRQLEAADSRADSILDFLKNEKKDGDNLSDESINLLLEVLNNESLLSGYSQEIDGTYLIFEGDVLVQSDDDDYFRPGMTMDDLADSEFARAVEASLEDGSIERLAFDAVRIGKDGSGDGEKLTITRVGEYLAYLYAQKSESTTVVAMLPSSRVFASRASTMLWVTLLALVLLLVVFLVTSRLLKRVVVSRIDETNKVLARVTEGDLDARLKVEGTSEFASLSQGINDTVGALQDWIHEAESRMDAELATAKAIQESALPRIFPPYPSIMRFDIYAIMDAAREVGGDFYDFFLIGEDSDTNGGKLGFVVADVSGKGVPAALFMMQAKTQLRDYLMSGMEPGEAVENANRQLCDGNDAGMFVTAWVGILDYATGHVSYVNAGHNPPLLWRNGSWEWVREHSGLPLGLYDSMPYQSFELDCQIGDQFLLYTDGVTEAMNVDGELYGEERLEQVARDHFMKHPRALVGAVRRAVSRHARGAEQSDDITILAMEVGVPPEVTASMMVPADDKELRHVNEFIHTELDRRLCPLRVQHQIDIAVEELFVNVAHYAYPDAPEGRPGMARISYTYASDPPSVRIDIADTGIPYNPLEKPDAVTPDNIEDVPIGGLGILMAKQSVDKMTYERVDGRNIVSIVKKW